ncbi:hypothetical protein Tco_0388056 [Tanacetum coccineum]
MVTCPPRPSYLKGLGGMRRVCSLEFRPKLMDSGLADPLLSSQDHFSKPLLTGTDDADEVTAKNNERDKVALQHIAKL